ncbi:MAG: Trk system potassium transporter TrkA [Ruminobacter sp.]|nr:Trk system potassium transporter TrkA [Ruminobacter sp.]
MKIIILGAGQVGSGLVEYLVNENNEITLVDNNYEKLQAIKNRFDIKVVQGYGSYPATLRSADADNADLLVAVTNSDEINMLACQLGYSLFHIPQKIARILNHDYIAEKELLFADQAIPVDNIIAPENLIMLEIVKLIEFPGVTQMAEFADGRLCMASVKAYYGGTNVGYPISSLKKTLNNVIAKIIAIYRQDKMIIINDNTVIEAGDEVYFIAAKSHVKQVISTLQKQELPYRRIMIIGGGNIARDLAMNICNKYSVKLIETNQNRATELANEFDPTSVQVFCSDPSDQNFLIEEHIDMMDLVIAVTDNDETNIMTALLAKKMGAKKAIVLIKKYAYINLLSNNAIDVYLSPKDATISALLTNIRRNGINNVKTLKHGLAEGMEIKLTGDSASSGVIGKKIKEIQFPMGIIIGAIARGNDIFIPGPEDVLQGNDLIIFFVSEKRSIKDLIKLTSPKATYFAGNSKERN